MWHIVVHDMNDIILVFEENWSQGNFDLPFPYIWWCVMQLWKQ